LSVPRAEFEGFIKNNGGILAKSVSQTVSHLIRPEVLHPPHPQPNSPASELETKTCEEAEAKGIVIVEEDWVRQKCSCDSDTEMERGYLHEMLRLGEDDSSHRAPFCKKAVGMQLTSTEDEEEKYVVLAFKKVGGEELMIIRKMDEEDAEPIEVDEDTLCDEYSIVPKEAEELWDKYQNRKISEGVWEGVATPSLLNEINTLVDILAAQEPVDLRPGTKGMVRDLVHPSLFPLLSDLSTCNDDNDDDDDGEKMNFWGRPYEVSRFQWLPAEVEIDETGTPHFVSDINNLDRSKYSTLYDGLECLLKEMLPGFQEVWQYANSMEFTEDQENWKWKTYGFPELLNFHNSTLQAIVQITDYELQPNEALESDLWHLHGVAQENIVMTGLFFPNFDESLGGGIEFQRTFNDSEAGYIFERMSDNLPRWLESQIKMGFLPLGQTITETGKLLIFPNCHAHRVMKIRNHSISLKTLHYRMIAFFIVDPDKRIASSKDFPPLPRQISLAQAQADRLELMQQRKSVKEYLYPKWIERC
jgi:hypothetical protein